MSDDPKDKPSEQELPSDNRIPLHEGTRTFSHIGDGPTASVPERPIHTDTTDSSNIMKSRDNTDATDKSDSGCDDK
ncbi:MAG: hypothetical protein JWO03_2384 [Bacteroidetes bacterium]|nr:hypothetical protein [Bacteroidota bacterium]